MKDLNKNKEKKNVIGAFKASFSGRKFRSGAFVTLVSTLVIVIVLVVNMLISQMNIQFDFSSNKLYSLSNETKNMVKGLKDDVTIYYLVQTGNENDIYQKIAKKYDALSDKIKLVKEDPVLNPKFASNYVTDTVTEGSFLVVNNRTKKAKYIDVSELAIQEMDYQTYQTQTTGYDVEGKLTSAIQYVTSTDQPIIYVVGGHGETESGQAFKDAMEKLNVTTKDLSTLSIKTIPKDCDILYINAPQTDFKAEEVKMLKDYLASGGKAIITCNYAAYSLSNFQSILNYYGIKMVDGVVFEGDSNMHYNNYPYYLLPNIEANTITSQLKDSRLPVLILKASGLHIMDTKRSSLTVGPILTTSASAYSKVGTQFQTYEKENGDINGPFYLGLEATDQYNNVTSKVIVYSSDLVFSDNAATQGNIDLLNGTVSDLIGNKDLVSIPSKSLAQDSIYPSQQQAILWAAFVVILIPAIILGIGIAVTLKRRKK